MALTRHRKTSCTRAYIGLVSLALASAIASQAAHVHSALPDAALRHNDLVQDTSTSSARPPKFLKPVNFPLSVYAADALEEAKRMTATMKQPSRILSEAERLDQLGEEGADEKMTSDANPSRALVSALAPASCRGTIPAPLTSFGLTRADEWLMGFLFYMWATLHPQDAAYYVGLSQRASSPALTPITGQADMLSALHHVNTMQVPTQRSPPGKLSPTLLHALLLELLTRTTASEGPGQPTEAGVN